MNKTWLAAGLMAGCCASLDAHAQSCPAGRIFRPSLGVCQPKSADNVRWLPNGQDKAPRAAGLAPLKTPDPKPAVARATPQPRIAASPAPAAAAAPRPVVPPLPRSLAGGDVAPAVTARPKATQGEGIDLSVVKAAQPAPTARPIPAAAGRATPAALTSAPPQRAAEPAPPAAASASPAAAAGPGGANPQAAGPAAEAVLPQAEPPMAALGYGEHALLPYSVPFLTPLPPPEAETRTARSESATSRVSSIPFWARF